jgi:predicted ATPase/DNA-binding CsgD family transcriptional regulator
MAELRVALDDAMSGHGRMITLSGEAGIGKTRLAQEVASYAESQNIRVLWGRCYEGEGAPPYWPWTLAIRSHVREQDSDALRSELGAGASDISEIVPDVRELLSDIQPHTALEDSEQARFRLFDSISTFLNNVASNSGGLVLILDNLHAADTSSLLLLEFLVQEFQNSRLLILGTYRDTDVSRQHPLSETLAELTRLPDPQSYRRVGLSGLNLGDVSQFIEAVANISVPLGIVAAIHAQTEGNPLFIIEVVRWLAQEGELSRYSSGDSDEIGDSPRTLAVSIPDGIREVIGKRLNRLSEPCGQTLAVASVIGREFSLPELVLLIDHMSEERLFDALEEAVAARVIDELSQSVDRYEFTHALIRETLSDELTGGRRARLHRRIGEAMEQLYAANLEAHLAQLSHHFFESHQVGAADEAVKYSTRAAQRQMALAAYEEATRRYEMALQALKFKEPDETNQRCDLLVGLGEAQNKAGQHLRARETFQIAASAAKRLGYFESLTDAVLGLEEVNWRPGLSDPNTVSLLAEVLTGLGEGNSVLKARVLAAQARALYLSGSVEMADAKGQQAVAMARELEDLPTLIRTLTVAAYARRSPKDLNSRLSAHREAMRLAEDSGDVEMQMAVIANLVIDLMEAGDIDEFMRQMSIFESLAEKIRQPFYTYIAKALRTTMSISSGRFDEAEQLTQQALAIGQRLRGQDATGVFGVHMFTLQRMRGRLNEIAPAVKMFVQDQSASAAWRPGLALIYAELGLEDEARAEFEHLATDDFAGIPTDGLWILCMAYLSEVCAFLNDPHRAAVLYEMTLPYHAQNIGMAGGVAYCGAVSRYLGMLAATMTRWEEAERHFEYALEMDANTGSWAWLAQTRYEYARMLLARNGPDDREKAQALLDDALTAAAEFGMRSTEEKALALKQQSGPERQAAAPTPFGLTAREVEVLGLIAEGKSNQQIADELFISIRTVINHVTNILNKTTASNRTEAAMLAARHGLV